ncbi:MAG: nitrogenase component 1 [bacterium]
MRFADIAALGQALQNSRDQRPEQVPHGGAGASVFDRDAGLRYRYLFAKDTRELLQQLGILTPELVFFCCADAECLHAPSAYYLVHYDLLEALFRTYGRMSALSLAVWEKIGFPHVGMDPEGALAGFLSLFAAAELGEEQVVFGAEERIEDGLVAACSLGSRSCLFHHSCIGRVTGVDWQSISRRAEARTGVPILHDANIGLEKFHADLAAQLAAHPAPRAAAEGATRRLNLVGFRDDQGARDLVALLSLLGFSVLGQPIPGLTGLTPEELRRAELQVLNPVPEYDQLYDDVFRRLGTPVLAPAAPYGFTRSRRWVEAIARQGGVDLDAHEPWRTYYEGHRATYTALQERARAHRVGLILTPAEGARLATEADAPLLLPIPVLALLEEMGFGIDLLLAPATEPAELAAREPDRGGRHSVAFASTPEEVDAWLADPRRRLIYSDLKRDLRLTAQGKAPFALLLFELGFEGACRAAEHLVRLCELDYFRDYRRHRRWPCAPLSD